jgi:hypothetical protein
MKQAPECRSNSLASNHQITVHPYSVFYRSPTVKTISIWSLFQQFPL